MENSELRYQIVEAESLRDLAERVTVFLNNGWSCLAGPFQVTGTFYQAVVKY